MKLTSIQSRRQAIYETLKQCRTQTLDLLGEINDTTFSQQAHNDFSPVGWHLGHIAYTEDYWILQRSAGLPATLPEYHKLFAADGLPKSQRQNLPSLEFILEYLELVRTKVYKYLETAPLAEKERLCYWLVQHESQHNETICIVLQLHRWHKSQGNISFNPPHNAPPTSQNSSLTEMVEIPSGDFWRGSEDIYAQDNERPLQKIYLDTYQIDRYPVTCQQYRQFMQAGGYQNPDFWSDAGWRWLQENPISQPLYWSNSKDWDFHPVCGVSWYEAQAYAKFIGKHLPTEAQWEKAASQIAPLTATTCNHNTLVGHTTPVNAYPEGQSSYGCYDMLGNVWEWTSSWFDGYGDIVGYPYAGYSQVYFDNQHRVLRGGSWATRPWALRSSFRNWYHPDVRQIFAGFRCVA